MATATDWIGETFYTDIFLNDHRLLTAKDLSEALAISEKTIYAYVSKGLIPYIKIESNVRFRPQAIREWLQQKEYLPRELHSKGSNGRAL
jgi:excisionase family DNA binding protein